MIELVRVDDRLLHGQVAYSWKADLGYNAIVIVSETAVNDDIRKMAIKMAKPEGVKLAIRNSQDAIELLNNEKLKNLKVFVVTDTIETAQKILTGIDESPVLNIGGIQKAPNKYPLTSFSYISESEKKILKAMSDSGQSIEFRLVPSDKAKMFKDL
ncbi:PTS sugar transporter subunit IIB [Enterococcus sp. LJL90]